MVVVAALISSTVINCIFPFFTYVESSGLLGEFLPQVCLNLGGLWCAICCLQLARCSQTSQAAVC
jgi:hypothetical protein